MAEITPELADLVRQVLLESALSPRDPLTQIADAERLARELSQLGDRLVGFFVDQARAEGYSWADIGARIGLSRQGAQQRYAPYLSRLTLADLSRAGAFKQFSPRAMDCLRRAEEHARRLRHDSIGAGHILLSVLDDARSLAVQAIRALGARPAGIRAELVHSLPTGDSTPPALIAVDSDARRAIDAAGAEAQSFGHQVATEHLLLGLLRNPGSTAGRLLGEHGVTRQAADGAVRELISKYLEAGK